MPASRRTLRFSRSAPESVTGALGTRVSEKAKGIGSGSDTPPAVARNHGEGGAAARGDRTTPHAPAWRPALRLGDEGRHQHPEAVDPADGSRAGLRLWGMWAGGARRSQLDRAAGGGYALGWPGGGGLSWAWAAATAPPGG